MISDNGMGIDQNNLPHIFEPFFTTKDVDKGTGLGLATVYGIVKQNNGYIYVSSMPGKGTIFNIYLPRFVSEEKSEAVTPEESPMHTGAGTIMLVEDDEMLRRITSVILQKIGYTVVTPLTPMEALRQFEQEKFRFDLLLTDVVMPEMSGAELAKQIAALRPDTRILFMSGYTSDYIVHHGVLEEGIHFIQKPFNMIELARKIRDVIGK